MVVTFQSLAKNFTDPEMTGTDFEGFREPYLCFLLRIGGVGPNF